MSMRLEVLAPPPSEEGSVDAEDDDWHRDADTPRDPVDEEENTVHHSLHPLSSVKVCLFEAEKKLQKRASLELWPGQKMTPLSTRLI